MQYAKVYVLERFKPLRNTWFTVTRNMADTGFPGKSLTLPHHRMIIRITLRENL